MELSTSNLYLSTPNVIQILPLFLAFSLKVHHLSSEAWACYCYQSMCYPSWLLSGGTVKVLCPAEKTKPRGWILGQCRPWKGRLKIHINLYEAGGFDYNMIWLLMHSRIYPRSRSRRFLSPLFCSLYLGFWTTHLDSHPERIQTRINPTRSC